MVQGSVVEVEAIDQHAIDAEVRGEREAIGGVGDNAVRVRRLLALLVRAAPVILHHLRCSPKRAFLLYRQHCDVAPDVVGDEHRAAGSVHAQVAGGASLRRLLVESREPTGIAVDGEGAHRTGRFPIVLRDFVHGVERAAARVDCEEGGV